MSLTKVAPSMLGNGSFVVSTTTTASALGYTSLHIAQGDRITVNDGVVFTIDVPFSAGIYQVFDGEGTVVFGEDVGNVLLPEGIYVDWFFTRSNNSSIFTDHIGIQKALDAPYGGPATIRFTGLYFLGGSIRPSSGQLLCGTGHEMKSGRNCATQLNFNSSPTRAIDCTISLGSTIRDMGISGPGPMVNTAVGIYEGRSNITLENVTINSWFIGLYCNENYYTKLWHCDFYDNDTGIIFNNNYNAELFATSFRGNIQDVGEGKTSINIRLTNGSCVNMHGGSLESYGIYGGVKMENGSLFNAYGTYFEAYNEAGSSVGIQLSDNSKVSVVGCTVNLINQERWINASNISNATIFARSNWFVVPASASDDHLAYVLPSTGLVDIATDTWDLVYGAAGSNTKYIVAPYSPLPVAGFRVSIPRNVAGLSVYEYSGGILANQVDSTATDVTTLKADFNALLAKLRNTGIMIP